MLVIYQNESKPGEDDILKKADIEKIKLAADYIDNNLSSLENIPEISRIAGLNTSKIQEGFKILYNQTVNEYAKQKRLEKAIKLLAEGNKNISEVVLELGLSSRSYFSKIFKEKYGLNPKEFVKNTTAKNIS
jgi:AraC-like DNA-binding protein